MSHFTTIVIGNNIDEQMAPYAEQDADEKYLEFHDTEDENKKEYEDETTKIVVLADGSLHHKHGEAFRKRVASTFETIYVYPEGSTIRDGKFTELYSTFEEFMTGWHNENKRDEKTNRYGYWHNPNAKWDWYSEGGRWTGYFKPKNGTKGKLGQPGAFDNKPTEGWVDSIKLGDIDIDGMLQASIDKANKTYDTLEAILKGRPLPSWNAIREKHGENTSQARVEYNSLEVVNDLNDAKFYVFGDFVETFCNSREEYVEKCKNQTMVPFSVVKDGKWYQKGEMGWFGMSTDEMTQDEWNKQFWKMIKELPPETELTLLDCHI
jgi:hypothetical protein